MTVTSMIPPACSYGGHEKPAPAGAVLPINCPVVGSILALAAVLQAWSQHVGTPLPDLARMTIR
jgi:hypothetical protein